MDDFVPGVVAEIKQDTESPFRNTSGAIPPAATPLPPNWRPSPLSLRDISPHCGESPFTREAKRLQKPRPPCKGGKSGVAAGGIAPEAKQNMRIIPLFYRVVFFVDKIDTLCYDVTVRYTL